MSARTPAVPASAPGALDEVRRWEHAAAARLQAEDQQAQRLEQARREAAELLRLARGDAEEAAERHRADALARARRESDEIRAAGRRDATALEEQLRRRLPDLVAHALDLVLPAPLPATPRTEA